MFLIAGCSSTPSSTPSQAVDREATSVVDSTRGSTDLFIDNQLPVPVKVSPRNPQGPWETKPAAMSYTAEPGQKIGLRLEPEDYFLFVFETWDDTKANPAPTFNLVISAGGSAETAVAPMRVRYKKHDEELHQQVIGFVYNVLDWQFGAEVSGKCGPTEPSTLLTYVDPRTKQVENARISIDCLSYDATYKLTQVPRPATITIGSARG
jgi:hypothetical protein